MQEFSIQGATPPPVSPVSRAFTTPVEKTARETTTKPAPLSGQELAILEIEAEEDGAIEIPGANDASNFFGEDGLDFADLIDVINPLQHIPGLSTLYRELTGDEISPGARLAGGAIYGGPIGFIMAAVNTIVETATGSDIGETIVTALTGGDDAQGDNTPGTPEIAQSANAANADAKTIHLTPNQPAINQIAAVVAHTNPAPLHSGTGTKYGGLASLGGGAVSAAPFASGASNPSLTNFFASSPARPNTPTEALLQARAAVPHAGSIPGLNNNTRSRFRPMQFQPPRFPPKGGQNTTAPREIGVQMSEKLALLAAQGQAPVTLTKPGTEPGTGTRTGVEPETPVSAPKPVSGTLSTTTPPAAPVEPPITESPAAISATTTAARLLDALQVSNPRSTTPKPLPSAQIPSAMRDALDRYEQMKSQHLNPG